MKKFWSSASVLTALAVVLAGCGSSYSGDPEIPEDAAPDPEPEVAQVRVLHAISDAPAVDIYLNGEPVEPLQGVPFAAASGFLEVPAGDAEIAIVPAGGTLEDALDVAGLGDPLTLEADEAYLVIAANTVAAPSARVYADQVEGPEEGAELRVIHLSPAAPGDVDIYLTGNDDALTANEQTATIAYDGTGDGEVLDYTPVPAGTYRVRATGAGADPSDDANIAYDYRDIELPEGFRATIVAIDGTRAVSPIDLAVLTPLEDSPVLVWQDDRVGVRVVHAVQGAGPVDVVNRDSGENIEGFENIDYLEIRGHLPLSLGAAAEAELTVGVSGAPVEDETLTLQRATDYTIIAVDTASASQAFLLPLVDELPRLPAGETLVRVVHAARNAGEVDVYVNDPPPVLAGFDEGDVSDFEGSPYAALPADTYSVAIAPANTSIGDAVIGPADFELESRGIYTLIAVGDAADTSTLDVRVVTDRVE